MEDTIHLYASGAKEEADEAEHERTYSKFVRFIRIVALASPLFFAFIFYWTT